MAQLGKTTETWEELVKNAPVYAGIESVKILEAREKSCLVYCQNRDMVGFIPTVGEGGLPQQLDEEHVYKFVTKKGVPRSFYEKTGFKIATCEQPFVKVGFDKLKTNSDGTILVEQKGKDFLLGKFSTDYVDIYKKQFDMPVKKAEEYAKAGLSYDKKPFFKVSKSLREELDKHFAPYKQEITQRKAEKAKDENQR